MDKIKGVLSNTELGKMKYELLNDTIIEDCFSKAKSYCFTTVKREEERKLKGITKATIKNQITIEDYKKAKYKGKIKNVTNYSIDSKEIIEQYRIAIDPFDDKSIRDCNSKIEFFY